MNKHRFLKHARQLQAMSVGYSSDCSPAFLSIEFGLGRYVGLIVLAILCLHLIPTPVAAQSSQVTIPILTKQVTLDGRWTTVDEWIDAIEIRVSGGAFKLKHDQSYLYILFDHVNDRSSENYDNAWAYIDTLKNGGSTPQTDDFAFSLQWLSPTQSILVVQKGTGTDWMTTTLALHSAASSTDATNDPYSSAPHVIYEFKIQLSILPQGVTAMGVRLSMQDGFTGTSAVWPSNSSRFEPNQWGTMQLGASPIPEFSAVTPILALGLIVPLYLLRRAKRQPKIQKSEVLVEFLNHPELSRNFVPETVVL